jgi:hypothetical protein
LGLSPPCNPIYRWWGVSPPPPLPLTHQYARCNVTHESCCENNITHTQKNLYQVCLLLFPSPILIIASAFMSCTHYFFLHQVFSLLLPLKITTSSFTRYDQKLYFQMVTFPKLVVLGLFQRTNLYNMSHIQFFKYDSEIFT